MAVVRQPPSSTPIHAITAVASSNLRQRNEAANRSRKTSPGQSDWGSLVRENIGALANAGVSVIAPSAAIASLTIAVNLVIDNLPGRAARERGAR